jgi:uncharacterized membrane protein YraQ (UPF0718 family)
MDVIFALLSKTLDQVWLTIQHNWPFLVVSILVAVLLKLYLDMNKVSAFLMRHRRAGVLGATVAAVTTPLCSCGTTAVILGMMAGAMPWAPIVAFMVSSPLTSPEELVYSAGLFGWPFALTFFISSIVLGLAGGLFGGILENSGWLKNQARFIGALQSQPIAQPASLNRVAAPALVAVSACGCDWSAPAQLVMAAEPCGCDGSGPAQLVFAAEPCGCGAAVALAPAAAPACGCSATPVSPACTCGSDSNAAPAPRVTFQRFLNESLQTAVRLVPMFIGFAFIGYLLNNLIPQEWVTAIFGKGNVYSVPLAATLGLPLYINTEASLPLVRAMLEGGMSQGAALAFLITGAGTSIGAMMGALTIARWRVIGLVVATLWAGAVVTGFIYDALLAARVF